MMLPSGDKQPVSTVHKNSGILGLFYGGLYMLVAIGSMMGFFVFLALTEVGIGGWAFTGFFSLYLLLTIWWMASGFRDLVHGTETVRGVVTKKIDDTNDPYYRPKRILHLADTRFEVRRRTFEAIGAGDEIEIVYWPRTRVVRSIIVLGSDDSAAS